jgi:deazaflavin-dependent oxidoreductase (nitroreductase family)
MAKQYQVNTFVRVSNAMTSFLLRMGVKMGNMALLTVRGRKSGKPITNPIVIVVQDGKRYLFSPFGIVNWVRNLRAAGGEIAITRGRRTEKLHAIELAPEVAAPIFRESMRTIPGYVRGYLNLTADSSLEEFEREIPTHPVFLLQAAM